MFDYQSLSIISEYRYEICHLDSNVRKNILTYLQMTNLIINLQNKTENNIFL